MGQGPLLKCDSFGRCRTLGVRHPGGGWARFAYTFVVRPGLLCFAFVSLVFLGCRDTEPALIGAERDRPSILLVTLDTTRADSIGPDAGGVSTPSFNAVAARGRRFTFAYATAPETLPSHLSMMSGLYAAGHGIHENGRSVLPTTSLLAERLQSAGYETSAFVSGFPLSRRFGLARGFDSYDDTMTRGGIERPARETTDAAVASLANGIGQPRFLWVHYFDPHHPYDQPGVRDGELATAYRAEIEAMDREMGRLIATFRAKAGAGAVIVIAGDHGESLGEHGEMQHGNLLYDPAMRVPLVIEGGGLRGVEQRPVSARRIFHTILDLAKVSEESLSFRREVSEVVAGEAMKPFLSYGWQPQVMAVAGGTKAIRAGSIEIYDLLRDPKESSNLTPAASLSRDMRRTLLEYPVPSSAKNAGATTLSDEDRKKLAALGYIAAEAPSSIRANAPRPADMTHLFEELDRASNLFVQENYGEAASVFRKILAADPGNATAMLRIAVSYSAIGRVEDADKAFDAALRANPDSEDIRYYRALHDARSGRVDRAEPVLQAALEDDPNRVAAIDALASLRERQRRLPEALALRKRAAALRVPSAPELSRIAALAMNLGDSETAADAFEKLRAAGRESFRNDLELGVVLLQLRRLEDARAALDRALARDPQNAMALFKRAQVAVLLREPDSTKRIARARAGADEWTRPLIERERLFQ
jgi:choline-sulfatase